MSSRGRKRPGNWRPKRFALGSPTPPGSPLEGMPNTVVIRRTLVEKMSDVLKAFVEPYQEIADTHEAYEKLLTVGMLAWNVALFPESEQQDEIEKMISEGLGQYSESVRADYRAMIEELAARKREHFPDVRRVIVSFDLTDTGRGYRLTVSSSRDLAPGAE